MGRIDWFWIAPLLLSEQVQDNSGCRRDLMNWNALRSPSALMSGNPCKWHSVSDSGASGFLGWTARSSRLETSDAWWVSLALDTFQSAQDSFGLFDQECRGFGKECVLPSHPLDCTMLTHLLKKSVAFLLILSSNLYGSKYVFYLLIWHLRTRLRDVKWWIGSWGRWSCESGSLDF